MDKQVTDRLNEKLDPTEISQREAFALPLSRGKFAIVDEADYAEFSKYKWSYKHNVRFGYAVRNVNRKIVFLHRLILDAPKGVCVDHINGNGLDNRRSNLRLGSNKQNLSNQPRRRIDTSGFKGVTWNAAAKKWMAQLGYGTSAYIGLYKDLKEAAAAYDKKALEIQGEFALTNKMMGLI